MFGISQAVRLTVRGKIPTEFEAATGDKRDENKTVNKTLTAIEQYIRFNSVIAKG
jgi:hypothetical protein